MNETDYQSILNDVRETVQHCGTLARDAFYSQDPEQPVSGKASIDVVIERKLHEALIARTPLFGFISEECPELAKAPSDHASHYWLVDPNDGTKPFQEGYRGASISVALIRGDVPVLGVVYAYAARCGVGDLYEWSEGGALRRNGLYVQWQRAHPVALVSNNAELKHDVYREHFAPLRYRPAPGIAFRLALVAAGQGAVAVSLGSPRDLDIAGGHALLIGAGLDLFDPDGTPLRYGYGHQRSQSAVIGGRFEDCAPFFGRLVLPKPKTPVLPPTWRITPSPAQLCERPNILEKLSGAFMGVLLADCLATVPDLLAAVETLPWSDGLGRMSPLSAALIDNMTALLDQSDADKLPHPGDGLCSTLPILLSSGATERRRWLDAQDGDLATFAQWLAHHLFPSEYPPSTSEIFTSLESSTHGAISFIDGLNLAAQAGIVDRRFLWLGAMLGARFGRNTLPEFLVTALTTRRPTDGFPVTRPDILVERIIHLGLTND